MSLSYLFGAIIDAIRKDAKPDPKKPITAEKAPAPKYKVVIDPGHGGKNGRPDPGAVGKFQGEKIYERNVVLNIGIELALFLEKRNVEVVLTRIDNKTLSTLSDKVEIEHQERPDVFVSIHCNSNAGRPAQGIETFYYRKSQKSAELAGFIQEELMTKFPSHRDRGVKPATFYVLRKTFAVSALVECEFINNKKQVEFLLNNAKGLAEAIGKGILEYLDSDS
jgi:N-acetylmuramoyl-L-alanine amidase